MRQTPVLRDTARWGSHGRLGVLALAVALMLGALGRTVSVVGAFPYLALLSALGTVVLAVCIAQLARVDDATSWLCLAFVALAFVVANVLALAFGLPGSATTRMTPALASTTAGAVILFGLSGVGSVAALRRLRHPRTRRPEHLDARAHAETVWAQRARPGRAHPAA
jgi:hypothetical protein